MSVNPKREIQVGIGVVALAAFSIFVVIPCGVKVPESIKVRVMAPDFWPLFVSTIALIAGVLVLIGGVLDLGRGKISTTTDSLDDSVPLNMEGDSYRPFREATVRVCAVVLALFALYFAVPHIGIVAGTIILLLFMIRFTGETRWHLIVLIAIILPAVLYAFFVYVANVPMPLGLFEQFR